MWKYVAKIIRENGDMTSSDPFDLFHDAQTFLCKSKDEHASLVITQIDQTGRDVTDHWLKRHTSHSPILDVPLHPVARTGTKYWKEHA
ncbi:MAG TPA: hypothetical protein VJQ06_09510 [Rhizomicrobium sp.]|nr:hypothetical protein [Rhizomicrobium sp.]